MRRVIAATLSAVALLLSASAVVAATSPQGLDARVHPGSSTSGRATVRHTPGRNLTMGGLLAPARAPVTMQVEAGWNGYYRAGAAWTPLRITLHNLKSVSVGGRIEVPDRTAGQESAAQKSTLGSYEEAIVLPPGASKELTLYVPGTDVGNELDVRFQDARGALASTSVFPVAFQDKDITLGALTSDPSATLWLSKIRVHDGNVHVLRLTASTLDALPEALASFDAIVLTNFDSAQLDAGQFRALERYVRDGGSLIVVGGPEWQESLGRLPSALLPGRPAGSEPLRNLSGLGSLYGAAPPARPTTVSLLTAVRGAELATERGIPLVVRRGLDNGVIEYLAFDPAVNPLASWKASGPFMSRLVSGAIPQATRRLSLRYGYGSVSFLKPTYGPVEMNTHVSAPTDASIRVALPILLTVLYTLLVGPVGFLALRRARRPGLTWVTVPAVVLIFTLVVGKVAPHVRASAAVVNSIGMVEMDGESSIYPATEYVGMAGPSTTAYRLTYGAAGLPMPIVASAAQGTEPIPTGWQFEEGAQTVVSFRHVEMGGSPAVELRTNVSIPGGIQAQLHLDHAGKVVGIIRNQTGLRLWRTAVIAGQAIQRLPDIPPGGALRVRILPWGDIHRHDYSPMPTRVYGQLPVGASGGPLEAQGSLDDRIRSALGAMPETTVFSMLGEMTFVAWTQKPLSPVLLDGSVPRRQSLTLIAKPLQVSFRHGPFELQSGTLGASLVDETPALPRYTCCSPSAQIVDIGAGGSATFEFDMPAGGQPHFSDLTLSVYGGGQDTSYTGYTDVPAGAAQAYDWRSNSWEALHFRNGEAQLVRPDRFISSTGALLLRLRVADDSHELVLTDPHKDLQVSGRGYIR